MEKIFLWLLVQLLCIIQNFAVMTSSQRCRCFPGKECWPSKDEWNHLNETVQGRLRFPISPLQPCFESDNLGSSCAAAVKDFKRDPFWIQTFSGGTQSTGQSKAWKAHQSEYVVEARNENDIVEAVKFADKHNLRLVVKGTGHDYYGRSSAANSLLIWTHHMKKMKFHDSFRPENCDSSIGEVSAVTLEPGLTWMDVYAQATPRKLYVQGGGCTSVGVVGFSIGGGYGSWSKYYGLSATNLLEARVVTADGKIVVASKCQNDDLFFALRGGGYGFGVIVSMTFRTHRLPDYFITTNNSYIVANNTQSFQSLIEKFFKFYRDNLSGPNWGDRVHIKPLRTADNPDGWRMEFQMMATNIAKQDAIHAWQPLTTWLSNHKNNYTYNINIHAIPAVKYWNVNNPDAVKSDYNAHEPNRTFYWKANYGEIHEYWLFALNSRYLRADQFLDGDSAALGAEKLMTFLRELPEINWDAIAVVLHLNKAQYGASKWALKELQDMPLPESVRDSFGLMLVSFGVENYNPLVPDEFQYNTSDLRLIQKLCKTNNIEECKTSQQFEKAMQKFRDATPGAGSYFNQADYFEPDYQENFWGQNNYAKLRKVKDKFDNKGLFVCHHCVGSEDWDQDGMCRKHIPTTTANPTPYTEPKKVTTTPSIGTTITPMKKYLTILFVTYITAVMI